jgi:cytochrome c-type biogenesis protein CcmE
MRTVHKRRLAIVIAAVAGLTAAGLFVANAFRSNLVYFFSPTEVYDGKAPKDKLFRIGGLVEKGTVQRLGDGLKVQFSVTDTNKTVPVYYEGILPDLFREGQGVVVQGRFDAERFVAREVLAKHDEKYMPPEAAKALEGAGYQMPPRQ